MPRHFLVTDYFVHRVMVDRSYATIELCIRVIRNPERVEIQPDGRIRFWARLDELGGRAPRVVTPNDARTILSAFMDRRFRP